MKEGTVHVDDLDDATKDKLGLNILPPELEDIGEDLVLLGRILKVLKDLPDADALEVLKKAQLYLVSRMPAPEIDSLGVALEKPAKIYVPEIDWVLEIVAQAMNTTVRLIKGRDKRGEAYEARALAIYVLGRATTHSLTAIGRAIGGRSPATASHAFNRTAMKVHTDDSYRDFVGGLVKMVEVKGASA